MNVSSYLNADPLDDRDWRPLRAQWQLRGDTTYLNHGSFGPPPIPVREAQANWKRQLDSQPMDFFVRRLEPAWQTARAAVARWIGAADDCMVFVENATAAMNVVADNFPLQADDEILLTDHEYGAVFRIWERACRAAHAKPPVVVSLPRPFRSPQDVVDAIASAITPRTKAVVVSHITSPTAVTLPVRPIGLAVQAAGAAFIVDGPHAPAQIELNFQSLPCDFYCASLHKWLSAPFGSGFLYADPRWHSRLAAPQLSWGRLLPNRPQRWDDEFLWSGTRDPSAYLAVPSAIEFLQSVDFDAFRRRTHGLARYARQRIFERFELEPLTPDDPAWFGAMAHCPLPPGPPETLQRRLWSDHGIEVPVVHWQDERFIRVSCHLYNDRHDIDRLVDALEQLVARGL